MANGIVLATGWEVYTANKMHSLVPRPSLASDFAVFKIGEERPEIASHAMTSAGRQMECTKNRAV